MNLIYFLIIFIVLMHAATMYYLVYVHKPCTMPQKKPINGTTPAQKTQIKKLHKSGKSISEVSQEMNIPYYIAHYWISRKKS